MARGWQGKSRGGKTGYAIFIFLIKHCGLGTAYVLLFFVSFYFIPAAPRSTVDIWHYARKVLRYGVLRSAVFIWKNYYSFGQSIIDRFAISAGLQDRFRFEFENLELMRDSVLAGNGAIVMGAHFGNWAAGEPFFKEFRAKLNLVMYDNEHADIKEVLAKNQDQDAAFKIIPVNKDNIAHVFMITEALSRGELVCFMADRYVNEEKLLDGKMLGRDIRLPFGPFHIAARIHVPVIFYYAVREAHRTYSFKFLKADVPSGRRGVEHAVVEQFTVSLENELRLHPEQWYNYYDFWNLRT